MLKGHPESNITNILIYEDEVSTFQGVPSSPSRLARAASAPWRLDLPSLSARRFGVWGVGFGIGGPGFTVWGLGFRG